uniref:Uncharacterized protein n=1 Tax=viral metagenome TaxID=1070528 RepID=A0A6C0AMQ9_9ZZZZ
MGLAESKLQPKVVKALIRQDSLSSLPSFSMDTAKFMDGSSGFVITTVDLAKNTEVRTVSIKFVYSPSDNCLVFVGNDDSTLTFLRDRLSGKVVCSMVSHNRDSIVRFCVTTYEPLDDAVIDKIGELYAKGL